MTDTLAEDWFTAPPDPRIGAGLRGQNQAAITALLDCITRRAGIHASHDDPPLRPLDGLQVQCQTSGSGGFTKTIRRSPQSWIASFRVNQQALGLGPGDSYAVLGALGHSLALYASLEALHLGASLQVLAGDSPRSQLGQVQGCSVLYATPTQLLRLQMAGQGSGQGASLPAMRHVICGGGRLDPSCRQGLHALFPNAVLREFYGASETSFATIADGDTPTGSVGRAYPGVRLRIGPDGRIWIASPYLAQGYADPLAPDFTRDGDFITVGDIGHLDASGHLYLQGRQSRMVTIADRNLFLEDLETVLTQAGAGLCAVIARPDPLRGHALIAVIEGTATDSQSRHLRQACKQALGDHAAPRQIHFLPQMPLLASGKPDLAALTRRFAT